MTESIKDEFIGKEGEIVKARNKQLLGLRGKIVDETRNSFKMLVYKRNFKEFKIVLKKDNYFRIGSKVFHGDKLMRRPEERVKLKNE